MQIIDESTKTCGFQAMVAMRDGARLNTFVFLPGSGGPRWPVILHRTPYGITAADASDKTDVTKAWLPSREEPLRGSILRGWRNIVAYGYAAVYQDTRGRHGSEGEDRVYADDAADGRDTLDWIASQPWSNQIVGMSGSSAGATTTFAAASTRHPALRAFFAQAGASSIYDDVVYEGQSIEMERLWAAFGEPAIVDDGPSHAARGCCEERIEDARMADTEHRDIGGLGQFCDVRIALPARHRGIIGVDRKYRTGKPDAIEGGDQPSPYRRLVRRTNDSNRFWPKERLEPHRSSLLQWIGRAEITTPRRSGQYVTD
jgi:predicted acyl esterase